jgi:hypothetical protein
MKAADRAALLMIELHYSQRAKFSLSSTQIF